MLPASLLVPSPCQGWLGHWGSLLNRCVEARDDESLIFMLTVVKTMMVPYNIAPQDYSTKHTSRITKGTTNLSALPRGRCGP